MSALSPLPVAPPPGVVLTESDRVIEGRWKASRNVRFVKGRPQKIGGNVRAITEPTDGSPRALHAWRDNSQNQYLAAGTYKKLYVYDTSFLRNDITPIRASGTLTDPFTTTNNSNVVTVSDTAHGLNPGDIAYYSGADPVGGLTIDGAYPVSLVNNADEYTITAGALATSGATGGGTVGFEYEIPVGVELGTYGLGYGVGGYGLDTYGTARSGSTIFIEPRIWSLDHFGKLLIAGYNGGSIYKFDPTLAQPWGRADLLSADPGLPTNVRFVFVTPERFIMALLDDMQVAWCSQGDYTIWTPATGNTANIRTLTEGTKLVAGRVLADFVSLIWTDAALYRFQYTGSTYIYNSSMVAKDCGLIAPGAAVTVGGIAYWQGQDTFWKYDGAVGPMANVEDIRKYVFDEVDVASAYQCSAVFIPQYNEIWFFYTLEGEVTPTKGVIYSINDQCWAPLDFGRVSGTHFTQGDTRPYMGTSDGYIYQHEVGHDDNGVILPWSLTLAPYAMSEGASRLDMEYAVMDFQDQVGDVSMQFRTWDRTNDSTVEETETETHPPVDSGTMDLRISGRYLGFIATGNSLGSYFRWGKPVVFVKPSGKRT